MKLLRYLIIAIILLVLAVPVIAYVAIQQMGADKLKPLIAKTVYEKTGRELTIDGDIGAELSFTPTLSAQGITLSNPEWAEQGAMAKIKDVRVELDLRALLEKRVIIDSLVIDGVDAVLAQETTRNSWTFEAPKTDTPKDTTSEEKTSTPAEADDVKDPFVNLEIGDIDLKNITVNFHDKGAHHTVTLPTIDVALQPVIKVGGVANYKGASTNFTVTSETADFAAITEKALAIALDTTLPKGSVAVNGSVSGLTATPTFTGTVKGNIPSLHHLNGLMPAGGLSPSEAIAFDTKLTANAKSVSATLNQTSYGATQITGNVKVNLAKKTPYINATLSVPSYVLPADKAAAPATGAAPAASKATASDALPLDGLKAVNGKFAITVGSVKKDAETLASDISVNATLDKGRLVISKYSANTAGGNAAGSAVISSAGSYSVKSQLNGYTAQNLLSRFTDYKNVSGGDVTLSLNLKSNGKTTQAIQQNVDGTVSYLLGKTSIAVPASASNIGNFLNLLRGKNSKGKSIELSCSVGQLTLNNGVAHTKTLLLDTPGAVVSANGSVNLNKKSVSMTLSPRTKLAGLSDLTIPVRVSGPFSNLKIAPDAKGTVKNLSRIGLSLIKDKSGVSQLLGPALANKLKGSNLAKTCLNDLPANQPSLTTKEGLKNLEKSLKTQGKTVEDNVRNIRDSLKGDGKNIEKDIRNIRDSVKGLKGLF